MLNIIHLAQPTVEDWLASPLYEIISLLPIIVDIVTVSLNSL